MKSYIVHLKNKFPDGTVLASENSIDVYQDGEHVVSMQKNGAGQWLDQSEQMGLNGRFCLAPIPKDARVHKLHKDGKMGLDEKHAERRAAGKKFQCQQSKKIKSIEELEIDGYKFDRASGVMLEAPKA